MTEMNAAEMALTQCQHIAYNGTLIIEDRRAHRLPLESANDYIAALEAKIERIANIAEAGEPEEDFRAMLDLARRGEEIIPGVTVGDVEAESRRIASTAEAGDMSTSDGLGHKTELWPPEGCTGAVMYDQRGKPSIQHDTGTCPIHEGDRLAAAKEQAQDNYGDAVSPDAVAIFCREFMQHGATNVELGRAVRKLLL